MTTRRSRAAHTPREAYRWRILCHTRDGSSAGTWSAGNHATENDNAVTGEPRPHRNDANPDLTEFDELVVGHWLHVEEMADRLWWMDIGGVVIWVKVRKNGDPKTVTVHLDYTVDGCTYEGDIA